MTDKQKLIKDHILMKHVRLSEVEQAQLIEKIIKSAPIEEIKVKLPDNSYITVSVPVITEWHVGMVVRKYVELDANKRWVMTVEDIEDKLLPQYICMTCKTVIGPIWDDDKNQCDCGAYEFEVWRVASI